MPALVRRRKPVGWHGSGSMGGGLCIQNSHDCGECRPEQSTAVAELDQSKGKGVAMLVSSFCFPNPQRHR